MVSLAHGLGVTGYLMTVGSGLEELEEIHEVLSYIFISVVILHIFGIVLHTIRHRELIGLSMIDGKKTDIRREDIITNTRAGVGILFIILVIVFGFYVLRNYDIQKQSIILFGKTLQLKENDRLEGKE